MKGRVFDSRTPVVWGSQAKAAMTRVIIKEEMQRWKKREEEDWIQSHS